MKSNRFYIRTGDYLIEDRYIHQSYRNDDDFVYIDNIPDFYTAVVISNALRNYHRLSSIDYDSRREFLKKTFEDYPYIKDHRVKQAKYTKI